MASTPSIKVQVLLGDAQVSCSLREYTWRLSKDALSPEDISIRFLVPGRELVGALHGRLVERARAGEQDGLRYWCSLLVSELFQPRRAIENRYISPVDLRQTDLSAIGPSGRAEIPLDKILQREPAHATVDDFERELVIALHKTPVEAEQAFSSPVQEIEDEVVAKLSRHAALEHVRSSTEPNRLTPEQAQNVRKAFTSLVERAIGARRLADVLAIPTAPTSDSSQVRHVSHLLAIRAKANLDAFVGLANKALYKTMAGQLTVPERRLFRFFFLPRRPAILGGFRGPVAENGWLMSLFANAPSAVRGHFVSSQFIRPREKGPEFWAEADARCRRYIVGLLRIGKEAVDLLREGDAKGDRRGELPLAGSKVDNLSTSHLEDPMIDFLDRRRNTPTVEDLARLTPRQRQVVELRDRGAGWTDIGHVLGIARQSAKEAGDAAQKKLGKASARRKRTRS